MRTEIEKEIEDEGDDIDSLLSVLLVLVVRRVWYDTETNNPDRQ